MSVNANYSLLLRRLWMRKIKLIGLYDCDQYWLINNYDDPQMLEWVNKPSQKIKLLNIYLIKDIICEEYQFDLIIIINLKEKKDEDNIEKILKKVIQKAILEDKADWDDFESIYLGGDSINKLEKVLEV